MRRLTSSLFVMVMLGCQRTAPGPTPIPPPRPSVGGDYGPVNVQELIGEHSCFGLGKSASERFTWTFDKRTFAMRADKDVLPAAVTQAVLGSEQKVKQIEGNWILSGRELKLTDLKADGAKVEGEPTLAPFRTPVLRIHFGSEQYRLQKSQKPPEDEDAQEPRMK
jgi:hypothetical protein